VCVSGGGGSGAVARAIVVDGVVTAIELLAGGKNYLSPTIFIAPPRPLTPFLVVRVCKVKVTMVGEPGMSYQLQSSPDMNTWTNEGIPFVAEGDIAEQELEASDQSRYFRLVRS
jgi:hypothetical protein